MTSSTVIAEASPNQFANRLDIVATQGIYLVPRVGTPVWEKPYNAEFAARLQVELHALEIVQLCRRRKYHEAADEWPIGRTPPEVREKREAELRALEELDDISSDDGSDNNHNKADWLPTPPGSAESPQAISHTRKRQRMSEEAEDGETKCPARMRVGSAEKSSNAENAIPTRPQGNVRKRRRIVNKDDEEESKGWPAKVRATAARPSSIWLQRLRPRQIAVKVGKQENAARPTKPHDPSSTRKYVYKSSTRNNPQREGATHQHRSQANLLRAPVSQAGSSISTAWSPNNNT